jgi:hypothetical protein
MSNGEWGVSPGTYLFGILGQGRVFLESLLDSLGVGDFE